MWWWRPPSPREQNRQPLPAPVGIPGSLRTRCEARQPLPSLTAHADDLLERFTNTALHDSLERVGRDPQRKLEPRERFLGTLALTAEWGEPSAVLPGVALAAHQLVLSLPGAEPTLTAQPVLAEVSRVVPELLPCFDALLAALFEGASLGEFLNLVETNSSPAASPPRPQSTGE